MCLHQQFKESYLNCVNILSGEGPTCNDDVDVVVHGREGASKERECVRDALVDLQET